MGASSRGDVRPSAATADEAIRYRVTHRTAYRYSRAMTDGYTVAYLLPRATPGQHVDWAEVDVEPAPDERAERRDVFGNRVLQVGIHHNHDALTLRAESEVVVAPTTIEDVALPWEDAVAITDSLHGAQALGVRPFLGASRYVPVSLPDGALERFARACFTPGRAVLEAVRALCHSIYAQFTFDPAFTEISTPLADVLAARRGVCQDFAHLSAAALRSLGLAARYVSGYLETEPPPGLPRLVGADASHAWCSVWVPERGWVDFDPTNDHLPVARHITVAWGRDYGDVAPARGVVIGPAATQQLAVAVDVRRIVGAG